MGEDHALEGIAVERKFSTRNKKIALGLEWENHRQSLWKRMKWNHKRSRRWIMLCPSRAS
ncbi:Tricorn protease-like protein [Bienertia sinuspersici]